MSVVMCTMSHPGLSGNMVPLPISCILEAPLNEWFDLCTNLLSPFVHEQTLHNLTGPASEFHYLTHNNLNLTSICSTCTLPFNTRTLKTSVLLSLYNHCCGPFCQQVIFQFAVHPAACLYFLENLLTCQNYLMTS